MIVQLLLEIVVRFSTGDIDSRKSSLELQVRVLIAGPTNPLLERAAAEALES